MKKLLSNLCLSALFALTTTTTYASTVLISEDWNNYNNGAAAAQFATQGGIWKAEAGGAAASITSFSSSSSGKGLEINALSGSWVRISTATGVSAANGVRYDSQMARIGDLQSFTRMRIQTTYELSGTTGYYLNITGSSLALSHLIGATTSELGSYTINPTLVVGTAYKFSFEVLVLDGKNTVNVYLNDSKVISVDDTHADRPNFATNDLFFGFDSRRVNDDNNAKAIYGDITITAIPEGNTAGLALLGLGSLAGARWVIRRRSTTMEA